MMSCSLCKNDTAEEFLDLGMQPLANKYPTADQFATEDFFPEKVYFCTACKNVQLGTIISRERMFEDYYYLSSVNQGLVRHFEGLAQHLKGARFVVDIGSNDGILLKPLKALGVKALGVEPSINVSKIANDAGLETITAFFDAQSARTIEEMHGKPDVIVASSVFTHLEDPHTFIEDVKSLMTPDGAFIIEVEYIGNIIRDVQFERFYLDRIFYYSLTSLAKLFDSHGMFVADVEMIEPHGGSLRVTAKKKGQGAATTRVSEQLAHEAASLSRETMHAFKASVDTHLAALKAMLMRYKDEGLNVAGYGAPARVATITNYGDIGPELIPFIVDDSPLKQNRFSPGKHIPIVPGAHLAAHKTDILIVFAYEYIDDIRKKTGNAYRYVVPIPPRELA